MILDCGNVDAKGKCVAEAEIRLGESRPERFAGPRGGRTLVSLENVDMEAGVKIGLGGGCHWCTEAVFQALAGVSRVEQGFIQSAPPEDSWSEAVIVTFDPATTPLEVLLEIHLRTHSATSHHKMRGKYRSAVYVYDAGTGVRAGKILRELQHGFEEPLVTRVLSLAAFRASDVRFKNYYLNGPERPFCRTYIDPKLTMLRRDYAHALRGNAEAAE